MKFSSTTIQKSTPDDQSNILEIIKNIGTKIRRFGVQMSGTCAASGVAVFQMNGTFFLVTKSQERAKFMQQIEKIVVYGKSGKDFYQRKTAKEAAALVVSLIENNKHL